MRHMLHHGWNREANLINKVIATTTKVPCQIIAPHKLQVRGMSELYSLRAWR